MRATLLLILLALVASCTDAPQKKDFQTYDQHVWQGLLDFHRGNYPSALDRFETAISIIGDDSAEPYLYGAVAAMHGQNFEKADSLIRTSIVLTNTDRRKFEEFEPLSPFWGHQVLDQILLDYNQLTQRYEENIPNRELKRELDSLIYIDKLVFQGYFDRELTHRVDSTNMVRMMEITGKIGWQDNLVPVLWNRRGNYGSEDWVWDFFKPAIDKAIADGQIRPVVWAQFEDERKVRTYSSQRYGMYPVLYDRFPLEEPERIDEIRDSIGLPPLWYMNEIYRLPMPASYNGPQPGEQRNIL